MKTDDIYVRYTESLKRLESDPQIFTNFKSDTYFNEILEHVDYEYGKKYLEQIKTEFKETPKNFLPIITLNDSIGNPVKYEFDGITMSPSNLRYIYHALLIKSKCATWFPNKKTIKILEIGGGYGGLCLYIKKIFTEVDVDYTIIDLPEPSALQNKFLQTTEQSNARSVSCFTIDELAASQTFDLVISNYCVSELSRQNQEEYFSKLINKCDKKFFIWNYLTRKKKLFFFKTLDIDFINKEEYVFEKERPFLPGDNQFIYSK